MENIKIQTQNKLENYQPTPELFYDVEGKVVAIDDKKLTLEKEVGFEVVEYTLNLKEKKEVAIGEEIEVEKEEIKSMKMEKKEKILPEDIENIGEVLKALGLQNTSGNVALVNKLIKQGIKPTKINIDNYMRSIENIDKIEEELDVETLVKLMDRDIDIESLSIDEIASQLDNMEVKEKGIFDVLKLKKDLDYKEAENISKKIFGQKMGKDVYDIIIALDKEGLEINQDNIEKSMEVLNKLSSIKDIETEDYIKILDTDADFTINNLYKVKNNYTKNSIDENKYARVMENMTVENEVDYSSLLKVLDMEGLDTSEENISLAREFILLDMDIDLGRVNKLKSMKNSLEFIKENLKLEEIAQLIENDVDILNTDIQDLQKLVEDTKTTKLEFEDLSFLDKVEDKHLLSLLREGKEFKLSDLKEIVVTDIDKDNSIEIKVLDKVKRFDSIFKFLGDKPEFKNVEYKKDISLNKIYEQGLKTEDALDIKSILKKEKDFLTLEFERFKENIDTKIIKKSIIDRIDLEKMPMEEANNYMENRINRYKRASELMQEFNTIYKNKENIIPSIINNQMDMDYKSLKDLGQFLNGEAGLIKTLEKISKNIDGNMKVELDSKKEDLSNKLKANQDIRKEYFELMSLMQNFEFSQDSSNSNARDEYFQMINKSSKKDLVMQLPVDINGFKDLNIIIPNMDKGIDKNNMNFKLSIETEKLGNISMDLEVIGRNIYLSAENIGLVEKYQDILREKLEKSGYNLVLGD